MGDRKNRFLLGFSIVLGVFMFSGLVSGQDSGEEDIFTQEIGLERGWNNIAVNVDSVSLSEAGGDCSFDYDPYSTGGVSGYAWTVTSEADGWEALGTESDLATTKGYSVWVPEACNLVFEGQQAAEVDERHLVGQQWNLITLPEEISPSDLENIIEDTDGVELGDWQGEKYWSNTGDEWIHPYSSLDNDRSFYVWVSDDVTVDLYTGSDEESESGSDDGNSENEEGSRTGLNHDVLYFSEDFSGEEVGGSSAGEWFESLRLPEPEDEALGFSESYVLRGSQSMRLHAENPENEGWDYSDVNSYRTEVGTHANRWSMWNNEAPYNVVGEPIWFSFSVYVPEDWEYHLDDGTTETINIAEFHANGLPSEMYEEPFTSGHRKPWVLSIWDNEFTLTNGYLSEGSGSDIDRAEIERAHRDIERGEWNDVVVNVEWADGGDPHQGFMKMWIQGELIYDHEGPTLLDSTEPPRPLKLSIYNSQWAGSDSYVDERTLYFDDVRFGWANATYEDMAPGN